MQPFFVMSAKAYSTPVTLPVGPAYLAGLLEVAGYKVGIIDAICEGMSLIRKSTCGRFMFHGLNAEEILSYVRPDT